ncbi:uncharacterized protein LOC135165513 isoform X2 [Diachasmimorpha longicaudata]
MDLEKVDFEKMVLCYTRSLEIFPDNPRMLNNCAAHYIRKESPREALPYLNRALSSAPDFLPAEWNRNYAYNLLIDRWHFPMLNDRNRNTCYERAISNRISQGYNTVLDIGTGSGLLSLYAKDSGSERVYACELSTEMSFIADKVFSTNNSTDITLLPQHSTSIEIPRDIPQKVKLVVTETFDVALFGEFVLSTLIHAHEHLLSADGIVLPMGATVFAAAVESPQIRFMSHVTPAAKSDLTLNFAGINICADNKNYEAISLREDKTLYLTDPVEILQVNFNDLSELKELHTDGTKNVSWVKVRKDGRIDGLVVWFKLDLDEENTLDTSEEDSCWQLAVFADKPVKCSIGQDLKITTELWREQLRCTYELPKDKNDNSNWRKCKDFYRISQHTVMFLNDDDYMSSIARVAQLHRTKRYRYILDLGPFPVYGLEMLKWNEEVLRVYCYAETEEFGDLIMRIAEQNGVDREKICIVESCEEIDRSLDVVFYHNFSTQGEINDWSEPSLYQALKLTLSTDGFILPRRIFLIGQLIYSEDLPRMVLVEDKNVQRSLGKSNYVIGDFVNQYSCRQRFDLDLALYKAVEVSEERVLVQIDEGNTTSAVANFGKIQQRGVLPNVLVCWYTIHLDGGNCVASRRENSFMNHSAIILEDEVKGVIERGEDVRFKVLQMTGLTRVSLVL